MKQNIQKSADFDSSRGGGKGKYKHIDGDVPHAMMNRKSVQTSTEQSDSCRQMIVTFNARSILAEGRLEAIVHEMLIFIGA